MKPFRWDLSRREQLGRLTEGECYEAYPEFIDDLRACCSRVLAFSEGGMLVFVGRSPESMFDYFSGVLSGTSHEEQLVLLNISNRGRPVSEIRKEDPTAYEGLVDHFQQCGVSPGDILSRKTKTYFTDIVARGGTFGEIAQFLHDWAAETSVPWRDLRKKLGFLGVTLKKKTSPNTWRWYQQSEWVQDLQVKHTRSVSIGDKLIYYLADYQPKTSWSHWPRWWGSEKSQKPPREEHILMALRTAYSIYLRGTEEKQLFSELLSRESAMMDAWFRQVVGELR